MEEPIYEMLPRENFPFLSDDEYGFLSKLRAIMGARAWGDYIVECSEDDLKERIHEYAQYESALVQAAVQTALASMPGGAIAAPPPAPAPVVVQVPTSPQSGLPGPKPVKVHVSTFQGNEGENLIFWMREVELATSVGLIRDPRAQVVFAISHLAGRAKSWALTYETNEPDYFPDWPTLKTAMQDMFLPPNSAFRQRSKFLACRQNKRDLYVFVQELRQLRASMAASPLPEDVMVCVFMEGLDYSPVKTEVFRQNPQTLESAIAIALREDHCLRQARGLPTNPAAQQETKRASGQAPGGTLPEAEPMDLSAMEAQKLRVRCFNCQQFGHFKRDCPALKKKTQTGKSGQASNGDKRRRRRPRGSKNYGSREEENSNTQ